MGEQASAYQDWIGTQEHLEDEIWLGQVRGMGATLDQTAHAYANGDALPPLWHWMYFLPRAPRSKIGTDGHPERGGFMPPIALPRRMFAGARMTFHRQLTIGQAATRDGEIIKVTVKEGKTGRLAFVTVRYQIRQNGELCIDEQQDIVYREPGAPIPPPTPSSSLPEPPQGSWIATVSPDPVLLFRFSALTFNAHRIHFDRRYAVEEEGYPGLVVHGPLTAVQLAQLVRDHTDRPLRHFDFRGQAPLFDLAPYRLVGTPIEGDIIELKAQGPDGTTTMAAQAALG